MSVSDLRHEAVTVRLSQKRDILGRHKRLLAEVFYFAKHPNTPPDSESGTEQPVAETDDLREFLNANDLESGHVFQESTLPQPQTVAVNASSVAEDPEVSAVATQVAPPPVPATPQNTAPPPQPVSSGSGRMVTRVSSGAIRHKSIGELLGEKDYTPKHNAPRSADVFRDPATIDVLVSGFQETPSVQKPPVSPPQRGRAAVFRDPALSATPSNKLDLERLQAAAEIFPLDHLISKAHKSVRTSDWTKALDEKETIMICNRIADLKEQGLWSLRQPEKQKAPPRPNTHWDYLLKEMEWMSTDFYEEGKHKKTAAFILARAVREYHESSDKEALLHKWPRRLRAPVKSFEEEVDADEDVLMVNPRGSASPMSLDHDIQPEPERYDHTTPMLVDSLQDTSTEPKFVEPEIDTLPTPPASSSELEELPAIFDLPSDVIYASVTELPKADGSSLSQLPIYGPPKLTDEPYHNPIDEMPIVPISKYCFDRYVMSVGEWQPPNPHYQRSTLEHEQPDDMLEISKEVQVEPIPTFAPAGQDPTHGPRRRTSAIVIRPPAPPAHLNDQKPSPWTPEEDSMLLQLAKENLYNFDLVSSTLSFSPSSASDLERRTAWECFERFRAIYPEPQNIQFVGPNRYNAAKARLNIMSTNKIKPTMILRQPRLEVRNHRYLNLFDVMRKSAKSREKQKAQEKPLIKKPKDNLPTKASVQIPTPLELARLKAERDRAFNQAMMAERQAAQSVRLQLSANTTPEMQDEIRRQWLAQQQAVYLNAQTSQAIRSNPGLGRGLVIPGGPNGRPMPIQPNTVRHMVPGSVRLPNGATATPEQVQQIIKARQIAMVAQQGGQNAVVQTPQQIQRLRALQQQAQFNAAQAAQAQAVGQASPAGTNANPVTDYMPFITQTNGTAPAQSPTQVTNLVQNNRLMQPPANGTAAQGIRQGTPQQQIQLPQQTAQGQTLRATPPRPASLSPTAQHFPGVGNPTINLQPVLQLVQQNNPQLSVQEATKIALDHVSRMQAGTNPLMQQHILQQLAKSSPTQQNQQIRRSPSQPANVQGQQRMS